MPVACSVIDTGTFPGRTGTESRRKLFASLDRRACHWGQGPRIVASPSQKGKKPAGMGAQPFTAREAGRECAGSRGTAVPQHFHPASTRRLPLVAFLRRRSGPRRTRLRTRFAWCHACPTVSCWLRCTRTQPSLSLDTSYDSPGRPLSREASSTGTQRNTRSKQANRTAGPGRLFTMETRFVVTPWRDADELLELRRDLFGTGLDVRDRAVNKVRQAIVVLPCLALPCLACRLCCPRRIPSLHVLSVRLCRVRV